MRGIIHSVVIAATVASSAILSSPPQALAQDISAEEVTRKVNIAGRQRMLSQRMAKASCMMSQGIGEGTHFDQLTQAYDLFQRSDNALRFGDESMGLTEERRQAVLRALRRIDGPWIGYSNIIEDVIDAGAAEQAEMSDLSDTSLQVLKFMNMAVNQTARSYGNVLPDVPLSLTITIDVAGRQRMLTQKAMKETCLLFLTGDISHALSLEGTTSLFELSLTALQEGFADVCVMAAPNTEIAEQLALVRNLWEPIRLELDRATLSGRVNREVLTRLARDSDVLLREMNRAVGMYETVKPAA
ncbi:MAG: type IV pili methyl-accepting chemotaxis transducer N-terminal domain-containing protein [Pseudomonadota bacterium]